MISVVILTKNEAPMLPACLACLVWCDEVIVLDSHSTDETVQIAQKAGARCFFSDSQSFAQRRTEALKYVTHDWVLYIDVDERVTPHLSKEILSITQNHVTHSTYTVTRQNIHYGTPMSAGGWQQDSVPRLFHKPALRHWSGDVHETPVFDGTSGELTHKLVHLTHRDTASGLIKSASWTIIEAQLLHQSGVPKVGVLTILRKGFMEFLRRAIFKKGYRDGMAGWVEAIIQAVNRMIIYIQVWELQQQPSIPEKYQHIEEQIAQEWKDSRS